MHGFVRHGTDDSWCLTRLEIACCAADAMVVRVRISGSKAPPRDQWIEVTGTWLEGSGLAPGVPVTLHATQVVEIDAPRDVYGEPERRWHAAQVPTSSTVWLTSMNPCSFAIWSAQRSTAGPCTSAVLPHQRHTRW